MESRRSRLPHEPVPLEIWSADRALMVKLDAALWLRLAKRTEVEMLLSHGCSDAGAETILIRFFQPLSDELEFVMNYAKQAATDLCCRVDRTAALSWISVHRPDLRPADRVWAERPGRGAPRRGRQSASTEQRGAALRKR